MRGEVALPLRRAGWTFFQGHDLKQGWAYLFESCLGPLVFQQAPVFDTDVEYGGLLRKVNITRLSDEAAMINQDTLVS